MVKVWGRSFRGIFSRETVRSSMEEREEKMLVFFFSRKYGVRGEMFILEFEEILFLKYCVKCCMMF